MQEGREEAGAHLAQRHRDFLREVALLLGDEEKEVFSKLRRDYQRDAFIERFWRVRDPFPDTSRNEFRDRWDANLQAAKDKFENLDDERARMILLNGPPEREMKSRCPDVLQSLEIWYYSGTPQLRSDFFLVFVQQGSRYRLWSPSHGLSSVLSWGFGRSEAEATQAVTRQCTRGDEILTALSRAVDWKLVEERVRLTPQPGAEWAQTFLAYSTDLPDTAEPLPATLHVDYPGRHRSRTVVQALVGVERSAAQVGLTGERSSYNFLVDGEVVRRGELFEHFRYRFDLPVPGVGQTDAPAPPERIPLVLQRFLRPGEYTLILRLQDLNSQKYFRDERHIEVPNVRVRPRVVVAEPSLTAVADSLEEANDTIDDEGAGDVSVKLRAPVGRLMTGKIRVEALTTGEGVARVQFGLNGRPIFSKTRPPFSVELDLGRSPRAHSVTATALDLDKHILARDEILLNTGPHRFAVRLIEPEQGRSYRRSVRAAAEVEVPEAETLDRVEFYLNDTLVASLYQPPFVQPILIPPAESLAYVRTVAYLKNGSAAEDLVFVNSPDLLHEVDVNMVELYTSVLDSKGRPAEGLTAEDFTVLEDGDEQTIHRFELVRDLPVHAGILLDTSTSMLDVLDEAEEAAMHFFQIVLTPRDRACLIIFNDDPQLAVRFTNSVEVLAGGLAGLSAEGETALYDSLIFALYYFSGIRGKRALILLSDGQDVSSNYSFEDVMEFARHTGVAIYTVGLDLASKDVDARNKLVRFAQETGGQSFFIESASELKSVYTRIQRELRTQYLITYQSSHSRESDRFREIKLRVGKRGLKAKTMRGYYP